MKVLVSIKRVIDAYVKVRVKSDGSGVEANKMSMNPFDEIAVEAAIRLKEESKASEVIVVSIGGKACQETLRNAMALGADRAIHVDTDVVYEPLNIAKILQSIVEKELPDLVILGKQSIDGDNNQTGQMLAGLLNWPQATFASKLEIDNKIITVTREVDGGLETITSSLPSILTTDLRLNEPRYASLPNIMKAKRKPLDVMEVSTLGLDLRAHSEVISLATPKPREAGEMLNGIDELIQKLKETEKVI